MVWSHGFTDFYLLTYKNVTVPPSLIVVCFMATCFPQKKHEFCMKKVICIYHIESQYIIHPIYILLS